MNAIIFNEQGDVFGYERHLCVEGKVHITEKCSFPNGDGCGGHHSFGDLQPCEGSCRPQLELPKEVVQLVEKFLASDGRERGEVHEEGETLGDHET